MTTPDPVGEALEHIVWERDEFEKRHGLTYCRRCGRVMVKDRDPSFVQSKPCRVVYVGLRSASERVLDA